MCKEPAALPLLHRTNHTSNQERVGTRIEQELEAPVQNSRNRALQFGKSNYPVLSGPTIVSGAAGLRRCASPLAK
jgi:hypothetical protein